MKKIYIIFTEKDVEFVKANSTENDIIYGDSKLLNGTLGYHIIPTLAYTEKINLIEKVRNFFEHLALKYEKDIFGFVNVFYLATILPIASYSHGLHQLLINESSKNKEIEIIFRKKYKLFFTALFFLAEHESNSVFMYPRAEIMQPYLVKICTQFKNAKITYIKNNTFSMLKYSLLIRRYLVLIIRFIYSILKYIFQPIKLESNNVRKTKYIIITRLPSKTEFLKPLIDLISKDVRIIIGETFSESRRNFLFSIKKINVNIKLLLPIYQIPFRILLDYYFYSLSKQFNIKEINFFTGLIDINLNQALREMLINYPDVKSYMYGLKNHIENIKNSSSIVLSTELTSQYAYADAEVSRLTESFCLHIMDCDITNDPLPCPIFGDKLIVDNLKNLDILKKTWPNERNKIEYWGSLRKVTNLQQVFPHAYNVRWCFFTSGEINTDHKVLNRLLYLKENYGLRFIIKLHPRDQKHRYIKYKNIEIFSEGDVSKSELINYFEFALTYNSGIINDLVTNNKPFLLLDLHSESYFNQHIHSDSFNDLIIRNLNSLEYALNNMEEYLLYYKKYRNIIISNYSKNINDFYFKLISL